MEIINERGEINLSKWMEKLKDINGLVRWAYKCV
jgi:hypothetical protein